MTFLGQRDGVGLRFDDGALAAIEMGRFERTFDLHEELPGAQPPGNPLPYLPLEGSLDMTEARYRGLDPYTGRQLHQGLNAGQRIVLLLQGQLLPASGLTEAVLARVHMAVVLSAPLVWTLQAGGEAVWEGDEAGAEIHLAKGCTVRVSAIQPLAIEDNGRTLRIDLPVGSSVVEMWVEALPPLPLAPAVIICAGRQIREAAIVASAVGSREQAYVPILDCELPPMTDDAFQETNARLSELATQASQIEEQMNKVAQQGGAQSAGGIVLPGARQVGKSIEDLAQQREKLMAEVEPVQQRMLAYAAWSRRSAVVGRLVAALTTGSQESPHVFVLAPYPALLLAEWGATADMTVLLPEQARSQAADWQKDLGQALPAGPVDVAFWKDAQDLASRVWKLVHGLSTPGFFTIPDEPAFYPVGLIDALRRGRALLPRGRAGAQVNLEQIQDALNKDNSSDHAVVVEADGTVASLIGALYAHHTGARLCINPAPRVDQAFESLRAMTENAQREQLATLAATSYRYIGEHRKTFMQSRTADPQLKQAAAGLSLLELPATVPTPYSDAAFVQSLTTYLTAQQSGVEKGYRYGDEQWRKDLATLESEATAGVAPHVAKVVAVVDRVTVFANGMPYSLASGWEGKAVGTVLRDLAGPLALRVVAQAGAGQPSLGLALALDPGLQQRPLAEAPDLVDRTITLRNQAASLTNLALLAGFLPLSAIVLHTQGNLDSVILSDARNRLAEVHASDLGAQLRLPSSPLVIYTTPLAWLGVGVVLIEQGAGGFVGALWPLEPSAAEDVTRSLLQAALIKGQNPADTLRSLPDFDPRQSRGYIFLGAATPRRATHHDPVAGAATLYAAAARLAASGRNDTATLVYDRLRLLTGEAAAGQPALRAEMMIADADFQARLVARRRERPAQDTIEKVWKHADAIATISLPEDDRKRAQIAIWERVAMLEIAAENFERAAELLESARDAHRQGSNAAAALSASYLLSLVQQRQGLWTKARQTLLEVQAGVAETGNGLGLVRVATSLAYVSLPLAMYPDVLNHLKLAVQAGLALGVQALSETMLDIQQIARVMAQSGATAHLADLAGALAAMIKSDRTLPEQDRTAITAVFALMQETAEVLKQNLPTAEREEKLAQLVEKAQAEELARSLGLDSWILAAGSPAADAATRGQRGAETAEGGDAATE